MFKKLQKIRNTALIVAICTLLAGALAEALKNEQVDNLYDGYSYSSLYDDYDDYDDDYDSYGTSGISPDLTVAAYEAASNTCTAVCAVALGVWGISLVALAFGEDMVDALKKPLSASDDNAKEPDAPTSPEADEHEPQRPQGTRFK